MVLVHVVLAPPMLIYRSRSMVAVAAIFDRADAGIPSHPSVTDRTVVLVNTPSDAFGGYIIVGRAAGGRPRPAHLYWLASAVSPVTVQRVDDRTLRISPEGGFLRQQVDQMLRAPGHPLLQGERIALSGVTIEIESVTGGRPLTAVARFDRPLDDPSLVWRRWGGRTFVAYTPPRVGATEVLPALNMRQLLE
jgi:hypothetical protein